MTQDFLIIDQAGIWLFEPISEAAKKFAHDSACFDEVMWRDQSLVVDYRAAGAFAEDLEDEGFKLTTRH
jgi:hypothetical protein